MEGLTGGIYVRTYESRRNESRRAYQQGVLRVPLGLSVFVETTPWEPT